MKATRATVVVMVMGLLGTASCASAGGNEENRLASREPIIYGNDDRYDAREYGDATFAARALEFTAALIPTSQIDASNPNDIDLGSVSYAQRFGICPDVRFASQLALADCSATLIDEDIVLTAGHCMNNCGDSRFVFNYAVLPDGTLPTITSNDVYACSRSLAYTQSNTGLDYGVWQLDRPVVGRTPAKVRTASSMLPAGTQLRVTGFPSGLPLKIADDAEIRSSSANQQQFVANLDTFRGNSGSGVFDLTSGELLGILVRGGQDYVQEGDCIRPNVCADDACRGEDVIYAFHPLQDVCQETEAAFCSCGDGVCGPNESASSCAADCSAP